MEKLAIMKDVGIGMRDAPVPILWFTVYVSEGVAALQVLSWEEAGKLIKTAGVHSVNHLNGKACFVEETDSLIKFLRVAKI